MSIPIDLVSTLFSLGDSSPSYKIRWFFLKCPPFSSLLPLSSFPPISPISFLSHSNPYLSLFLLPGVVLSFYGGLEFRIQNLWIQEFGFYTVEEMGGVGVKKRVIQLLRNNIKFIKFIISYQFKRWAHKNQWNAHLEIPELNWLSISRPFSRPAMTVFLLLSFWYKELASVEIVGLNYLLTAAIVVVIFASQDALIFI